MAGCPGDVSLQVDISVYTCKSQQSVCTQARNKPADGGGHVNQKGQAGQKCSAAATNKQCQTPVKKPPTAQKGQVKTQPKPAPAPVKAANNKKNKKGQRHQQHDLVVTINLVSSQL